MSASEEAQRMYPNMPDLQAAFIRGWQSCAAYQLAAMNQDLASDEQVH